ncbi:substrate-binding domain-containing protein [Pseudokineococcus marinus]|uniref:Substrate-binding domain-containing protein n=1 Tax=Pseudokineococcus marinus TaxID=351215 RepID=A0A849BLT5_9ACTN|nr:substrate-binding domain-containing protein [Pseudokineococcus marinus]NNH21604.1 substrate-binding domain-containing protein [Pseudokineococcus marinus]
MTRPSLRPLSFAVLPVLLLASACGGEQDATSSDTPSGDGGDVRVAAVIKGLDNPFFQAMRDGIEAGASDAGVGVEVQAAQSITDTTGQAERLTALAQQSYDCYVVNPITGNNLVQGLAQLPEGTPVVNIDQPVDEEAAQAAGLEIDSYIGTDNEAAGALAGEHMVELLGGSGTVGLVAGVAGDVTSAARIDGFSSAASDLDLLPVVSADWNRQQALTAATDLITANPDIKGFFAANDDMGLGIARAVANAGLEDQISVISVDGNEEALQAVADGDLAATVAQYPYAVGQLGVEACASLARGEDVEAEVDAPVALVTPDVAEQALAAFPQPFEDGAAAASPTAG